MMIHFTGVVLITAGFLLAALSAGTPLLALFDLASVLIILVPATGAVLIGCGFKTGIAALLFVITGILKPTEDAVGIQRALRIAAKVSLSAGVAGTLIGVVGILAYMSAFESPAGPIVVTQGQPRAIAASLLTILYALFAYTILLPARLRIDSTKNPQ